MTEPQKTCAWREYDPVKGGTFETECDHLFTVMEGSPADNGFNFCPYCGGHLVEWE